MTKLTDAILIFDDNDEDFEMMTGALRLANMRSRLIRCPSEKDAIRFTRREGEFANMGRPALIILDLNVSIADGRTLLQLFRQTEWLGAVPITILTASANPDDVELCYKAGANAYLVKPVNAERFDAMVQSLVTFWFDTAMLPPETRINIETAG